VVRVLKALVVGAAFAVSAGVTVMTVAGPVSGVVAIVSAKSAIKELSKSQVSDLFLGKTSRFPDGVLAMPIDLAEGSSQRAEFYARLDGRSAAQMKAYWSKIIFTGRGLPPMAVVSDAEMKQRVAENPAAIGYIDGSLVDASVRVLF
jgi:ABC-type phosphate transport system substrate-binding protein